MRCFLAALLLAVVFTTGIYAVDDLCTRSPVRTCSDNTALEALFLGHGPLSTLNCNFSLRAALDGIAFPYSISSIDPTSPGGPFPNAGYAPASQGPAINFTLTDEKIDTFLAPYPNQYGSSNVIWMAMVALNLSKSKPNEKIFVTDCGAFQGGYSGTWLVDEFNGRAKNSSGVFKKINVVVQNLYGK
ncbi:unnamed protein product [Diplocarpon coronariae]